MKTNFSRRVFNFNLPDELREHIKVASLGRCTTISQYIIDLIVKDREEYNEKSKVK